MDYCINRSQPMDIDKEVSSLKSADFRLYIRGMYPDSVRALILSRAICKGYQKGSCRLEIIDTLNEPECILADDITEIPALVRLSPLSVIHISDDLEDPKQIIRKLGLQ